MRILISAEPQGFGLSCIAVNLTSLLKGHHVGFIGRDLAYEYFIKEGRDAYNFKDFKDLKQIINILKQCELFISINESKLAIIAKKIGLKVVYLDLLYWLWPLELNDRIEEDAEVLKKMPFDKLIEVFDDNGNGLYNEAFIKRRGFFSIIAGLMSDATFIQNFPHLSERKKEIFKKKNAHFIRPFIKKYSFKKNILQTKKNRIFVSLGGIPLQNNYAEVFTKVLKNMKKTNAFKIASSPIQIEHKTYRHIELMKEILNSDIVLTPPGFITMFEIFSSNKPIFYLPPKNAGQYEIFNVFKDYDLTDFIINWEDVYPAVRSLGNAWEVMKVVEDNMLNDRALPLVLSDRITGALKNILNKPEAYNGLIEKQSRFLETISMGNDNLEDCLKKIFKI